MRTGRLRDGSGRFLGGDGRCEHLTDRERESVRLYAEGWMAEQIGMELGIAEKTAVRHLHNARRKLGVHNKAGLARWAIREGLIEA